MRFLTLLSLLPTLSLAASAVLDLTPSNFDSVVLKANKPALVEFFAPWCGHCKTLAPIYEELGAAFAHAKDKVSIAKVDADANRDLGQRFGVQGFPTLKWFDGVSETPVDYNSGRDLESLISFIEGKLDGKVTAKKGKSGEAAAEDEVVMLTDATFDGTVGGDKAVLVAFTAPWCGHCKTLAPVWSSLSKTFAPDSSLVTIAKVDADSPGSKRVAGEYSVTSYPTIKYFPAGTKKAQEYKAGRSEVDFVNYLNEKAGLHRVVGGGLDASAGTIASLDELITTYITGGNAEEKFGGLVEQMKSSIADVKDNYAQYYVKVLDKLSNNAGYVEKEAKRLTGLIGKGGLAPEKLDDLTKRSNILARFKDLVASGTEKVAEVTNSIKEEL